MGNCLKTQLKESVNNDSLAIYGSIELILTPYQDVSLYYRANGATKAIIKGTGYFTDDAGNANYTQSISLNNNYFYIKNITEGDKLLLISKYDMTNLILQEKTERQLKKNSTLLLPYCDKLQEINISKQNGNVNFDFNEFSKINSVLTFFRYQNNIKIVGDIETIVENMIAGGRNSGSLVILADYSHIKLDHVDCMYASNKAVKITFNSATDVQVNRGEDGSGALLASWNGTTWTYPS